MQTDHDILIETQRLAQENNKMLHGMRRSAFIGAVLKVIFYLVLILAPLWLYAHYLAPVVATFQQQLSAVQSSGSKTQADFSALQDLLSQMQRIPGFGTPTTQGQ